jgi:hypothetical protein
MGHQPAGINEGGALPVPSIASELTLGDRRSKGFLIERRGIYPMKRVFLLAAPLLLVFAFPGEGQAQNNENGRNCQQQSSGRSAARSVLGGLGRMALGRVGGVASVVSYPMTEMLSDAIVNLLDCREQQKAAAATDEAIRGGPGTTVNWTSESRQGVAGSSTVTAASGDCMTVTDVVIVDGEETRAPKQMCRRPPSNRYVRV